MLGSIVRRTVVLGALAVGLSGGAVAATVPAEGGIVPARAWWPAPVEASGNFEAIIVPETFAFRDVAGGCELTVDGTLRFSGTVAGDAVGTTTALVFAPCSQAAPAPPGTFADLFRFEGTFTGAVAGEAVVSELRYAGVTRAGGVIDAAVWLAGEVPVVAQADALVAVGGSYDGVALT